MKDCRGENATCFSANSEDQNSNETSLNEDEIYVTLKNSSQECLELCRNVTEGATCKTNSFTGNNYCYAHTKMNNEYSCWIFSKGREEKGK